MDLFKCCLCGKDTKEFGNNPDPLPSINDSDECCDECNETKVIPARLSSLFNIGGLTNSYNQSNLKREG